MLDFLLLVTSKNIVVSLAIMGAILTTFARALSGFVVSLIGDRRFESRDLAVNRIAKVFQRVAMWPCLLVFSCSLFLGLLLICPEFDIWLA